MRNLKGIIFFICSILIAQSCKKNTNIIIGNSEDYNAFLINADSLKRSKLHRQINFWETKFKAHPTQYPYLNKLASLYEKQFAINGNVLNLIKAENLYKKALILVDSSQVNILHNLCRNYISQHKFKPCLPLLKKASLVGEKQNITNQISFDVHMELGNISDAQSYLTLIKKPKDFNYLIRKSKLEDHNGNLNNAIGFLEAAKTIATKQSNNNLKSWSYSNLGDYYGHQGNIKKAYNYYLKTLRVEPTNYYALKGIAWIQYAHNKNTIEANRILDTIIKHSQNPSLYLFKAELAEYCKDSILKTHFENQFLEVTKKSNYGNMYLTPRAIILAEKEPKKAIKIAQQEVTNRPTAMSYSLLAWCLYKNKEIEKAFTITKTHVDGATSEPLALLHTSLIYKEQNAFPKKIKAFKKELQNAAFELGPVTYAQVKNLIP